MRVFAAGVATETNTFAPFPTGIQSFAREGIHRGNGSDIGQSAFDLIVRRLRARATRDGHEWIEGLVTFAQPSGMTIRSVYEAFRGEILADLRSKGPFDIVLLALHGAMVAHGYDDCEGDLIRMVRKTVGPTAVIGVELDPHCHLTGPMIENANAIVIMKEYPHIDFEERAEELYSICVDAAAGRVRPVMATFDCRMIGFFPTTIEPMASFVNEMRAAEKTRGILSVSCVHGFPWADVADVGSKMLVISDGTDYAARSLAEELGRRFFSLRHTLFRPLPGIQEALQQARATRGRIVLADTADNAGGGAPGDDTRLLAAVLNAGLERAAFGCMWDPQAAIIAAEAGVGAQFGLRLGGKSGRASGAPLDVSVHVRAVKEDHDQSGLGTARQPLGLSVWMEVGGVDVVVASIRSQTFAPDAFTGLGVNLEAKRYIFVKSSQHFVRHFGDMADQIIHIATPGALGMDFAQIPYTKRDHNYFPRVENPFSGSVSPPALSK